MSWLGANPQPGDWVVLTETVKTTLTDHLLDGGLRRGTRGVVTRALGWGAVEVRLDTGLFGAVTTRVRAGQLRVIRRAGGAEAFAARTSGVNAVRAGVALALIAPLLYFTVAWFLGGGTKDGLLVAVIDGVLQGCLDLLAFGLGHPVDAGLYMVVVAVASRFAFGR